MELTPFAKKVLESRYLKKRGDKVETPDDMLNRVSTDIAEAESSSELKKKCRKAFYEIMDKQLFFPNSPTLANAGFPNPLLSGCFVLPIEDSMDSIFSRLRDIAMIQKHGGGTGMSFSKIRPRGDPVSTTQGVASGPVAFMAAYNGVTESVKQGGMRRGANMGILRVDHPDIEEFIKCKDIEGHLANFNISVAITDEFMELVQSKGKLALRNPKNQRITDSVDALDLYKKIAYQAWKNGEPGVWFIDVTNRFHKVEGAIESTNPCGEQPLMPFESCNLGSINLAKMITKGGEVDFELLTETIYTAVRFLDNVIDRNVYPLDKIEKVTKGNRKIGLGVMGWHDLLIQLGIPYDSDQAIELIHEIMSQFQEDAEQASVELADEKGPFPNYTSSVYKGDKHPPRNAERVTIAPTGTLAILGDCSSGIEPNFALIYKRNVLNESFEIKNKYFEKEMKGLDITWATIWENNGTLKGLGVPPQVKHLYKTSMEIPWRWHIRQQAAFQTYVDAAVSKTINAPNETTQEEFEQMIMMAWQMGCKGLTIYRDGSREEQVLTTKVHGAGSRPMKRPHILDAKCIKIKTGCGSLFATVSLNEGQVFEVLTNIGRSGGCAQATTEALCRMISIALRSGVALDEIVDQLEGIRCPHVGPAEGEKPALSCPDAIAKALCKVQIVKKKTRPIAPCPKCGGRLMFVEGCEQCSECDYWRC
jgi:ribonucleoside-diphosphate reductase alpha chain